MKNSNINLVYCLHEEFLGKILSLLKLINPVAYSLSTKFLGNPTTIKSLLSTDNGSTNALLQIRSFCFELDGCPALHEYRPDISAFLHVHALGLPGFGAAENWPNWQKHDFEW